MRYCLHYSNEAFVHIDSNENEIHYGNENFGNERVIILTVKDNVTIQNILMALEVDTTFFNQNRIVFPS